MCPWVSRIFSGVTFNLSIASRMRATSPPGSTIAARLVTVQATIEQFCANGVTGTMETLSGCMEGSAYEGRSPSYRQPVLLREGFQRRARTGAEMLDHFGRRER